jgi:hypothetical protein
MNLYRVCFLLFMIAVNGCAHQSSKELSSTQENATSSQSTPKKALGTGTLIIQDIVYSEDAGVPDAVKQECNLLNELSGNIKSAVASQYATVLEGANQGPANADVLTIEIINLVGPSGGAWSGGKSVMIKGLLTKQGKRIGSFKALRVSGGGMWGAYMGTCAILGRCVTTLGEDVADWLKNPVDNAKLGNL